MCDNSETIWAIVVAVILIGVAFLGARYFVSGFILGHFF
jgi:hypothetical protein